MNLKTCNVLFILLLLGSLPGSAFALDATAIVEAIQKQYDITDTFQARCIQKSYLKILGQSQKAEGSVSIKKPGQRKWEYKAPDLQSLVSNDQDVAESALQQDIPEQRLNTGNRLSHAFHPRRRLLLHGY